MLNIVGPDGTLTAIVARQVLGRAQLGVSDSSVSRDQLEVAPIDGVDDAVEVRVTGKNGTVAAAAF